MINYEMPMKDQPIPFPFHVHPLCLEVLQSHQPILLVTQLGCSTCIYIYIKSTYYDKL